jgi:hypothetical protein
MEYFDIPCVQLSAGFCDLTTIIEERGIESSILAV